jgi:DNA polymerase-4
MEILEKIRFTKDVRLLGVSISNESMEPVNGSLFGEEHLSPRGSSRLQDALDQINNRYGEFTLARADMIPGFGEQKVISPSWRRTGIRKSD